MGLFACSYGQMTNWQIPLIALWSLMTLVIGKILVGRYMSGNFRLNDMLLSLMNLSEMLTLLFIIFRNYCEYFINSDFVCKRLIPYFTACSRYSIQIFIIIVSLERWVDHFDLQHPFYWLSLSAITILCIHSSWPVSQSMDCLLYFWSVYHPYFSWPLQLCCLRTRAVILTMILTILTIEDNYYDYDNTGDFFGPSTQSPPTNLTLPTDKVSKFLWAFAI